MKREIGMPVGPSPKRSRKSKKDQDSVPTDTPRSADPLGSVPVRDQKMLWGAAAGRCSFPKCAKRLIADPSRVEPEVLLGEMAHIVAKSTLGPRGEFTISDEERNRYRNLILLCEEHHKIVDAQRATYPREILLRFKVEHERRCQEPFGSIEPVASANRQWSTETVFSTLMPVLELPKKVFSAEALVTDPAILRNEFFELTGRRPPAFTIREARLFAFEDLEDDAGLFSRWVRPHTTQRLAARSMWDDPDLYRYYVTILNVVLRKLAGARGLMLSKEDLHWLFPVGPNGEEVSKKYQPLNKAEVDRQVAWRPVIRATGEKRSHWEHLAIGLRFHRVSADAWVLAMRPERHFTLDGTTPLSFKRNTRRANKRISHLYNDDMLADTNFWRSYLAEGKPRIIWRFGSQALIIDARLLDAKVTWPGVPDDKLNYKNAIPVDDLFTRADLLDALGDDDDEMESEEGEEDEPLDE